MATRGHRLPPEALVSSPPPAVGAVYVVGRRPIQFGRYTLPPGVEVPGAADWLRLESRLTTRMLVPAGPEYVHFEDWAAANPLPEPEPENVEASPETVDA